MITKPPQFFTTKRIRDYFLAGLLVWIPIWVTLLVISFVVSLLDSSLSLLPDGYQPQHLFGVRLPGLGVLLSILILFFTGMLVTNFLGRKLFDWAESIVNRIPVVRSVYMGTKQIIETLFSSSSDSFRKVLLIEYPRKGLWTIAFQTGSSGIDEIEQITNEELITVFVPTTPNPTAGFILMLPKNDAVELTMTVEQALKFIISLGVIPAGSTIVTNETLK